MAANPPQAQPGSTLPSHAVEVSQARIDRYAELSGDHNPLHVDPEFARQTPFGGTIAHGTLGVAFFFEVLGQWQGAEWAPGMECEFVFTAPVRAGDTVTTTGQVEEVVSDERGEWCVVALDARNQQGDTVIAGKARLPLAH